MRLIDNNILLWATIAAFGVLLLLTMFIRLGLKDKGERDLIAPPTAEELAKSEVGERVALLPERQNIELDAQEPVVDPAAAINLENRTEPEMGDLETESSYTTDQLMEREVKAMLLQRTPDRAVSYVMQVKSVSEDEAQSIVARIAG